MNGWLILAAGVAWGVALAAVLDRLVCAAYRDAERRAGVMDDEDCSREDWEDI